MPSALITGAADRIGKEIAISLAEIGFDIALHYNSATEKAKQTSREIAELGVKCQLFKYNFDNPKEVFNLFEDVSKYFHLDVLVNNASIFNESSLFDLDNSDFDKSFRINLQAPYLLTKYFAKKFIKGHIINITDAKAVTNRSKNFNYLLFKKTLADLTEMSAVHLGPNIRVNAVAPGILLAPEGKDEDYVNRLAQKIPLKRTGNLKNIKQTIKFLIENDYLTGQIIYVDGGLQL